MAFKFFIYLMLISGISPLHNILPAFEHFPYGIMMFLFVRKFTLQYIVLLYLMIVFYSLSCMYHSSGGVELSLFSGLIQMMNFTAPLFFLKDNEESITSAATYVFWAYIAVGLLQMTHVLTYIEPAMRFLIARFYGSPIGGYRGVTMLETEPARASFQLLMLYIISTAFDRRQLYVKSVALLVAVFVMISATTGIIITLTYFVFLSARKISPLRILFGGILVFSAILYLGQSHPKIEVLLSYWRKDGFEGVYVALSAISGGRFLGTVETIRDILRWPLGHGADPDFLLGGKVELNQSDVTGYRTRVSTRPISAILNYVYYFGLLMLIPLWLALRATVGHLFFGMKAAALLIIGIVYTPPGNEAWLIALCLVLKVRPQIS